MPENSPFALSQIRGSLQIVCTPEDAYRCFMRTEMDASVLENYVLGKANQKPVLEKRDWENEFKLD